MSEPGSPLERPGSIEVIVGSMYSGKTEELIRRLRRAQIARQKVEIFKPAIDQRYAQDAIVSHSDLRIPSRAVKDAREILRYAHEAEVIGIDEGQFLGPDLVQVCNRLARRGKRVIVAGLDQDYAGRPFEPMPQLLAIAEYITKTLAICVVCGSPANRTYRKLRRSGRVVVGGTDLYEARCRRCYELGRRVSAPGDAARNAVAATPIGGKNAGSKTGRPARRRARRGPRRRVR
ncbi:MAG: thymidine kinase [Candidatus Eisenbacteria bacterium]|nr:thymidine kinase [Candidatus Eisenbacteria bacterium]